MTTANRIFSWGLILVFVLGFTLIPNSTVQAIPLPAGTTYTWNQTGTASWAVSTNWTPTRTTPAATDILVFNGGGAVTVTNVPAQTIAQLLLSNNSTVNLQAAAANTLTIAGDTGTDLSVPTGSTLNFNGTNALTVLLGAGATGSISGTMTCSTGQSKLNANDASAITFNSGAVFTQASGCTGNAFTNAGTANAIVFASGSTFVFQTGSNPFALSAPSSKVVFQTGSLYRHETTGAPSFSGRTYANFELNYASANITSTGGSALSIDNLTITSGTLNLGMTGTFNLKGNISVANGTTLNFNPASSATLTLNGTAAQTISGTGTLTFSANQTVAINNTNGVSLQRDVTLGGPLVLTAGDVNTGANTLSLTNTSVTGTGDVVGNVFRPGPFTTGTNYPFNNANTIIVNNNLSFPAGITVTLTKSAPGGLSNAIARIYTITPMDLQTFNATLTLRYLQSEANAIPSLDESTLRPFKKISGTWTEQTGTVDAVNDFVTATSVTSFSDWAIAESPSLLPSNPSGSGSANPSSLVATAPTLLSVAVTPGTNPTSTGLGVACDLTSIGGVASQTFYDNGTNGDITSGDKTFSYSTTVASSTTAGAKSLPCTITDAQSRSGSTTIGLTVLPVLPIGTVNGPVLNTDDGTLHQSPYKGSSVIIRGVIYEKTLQAISNSVNTYKGFYIQNTSATADADPNTSDGLFVFMNTVSTFNGYTPTVGDEIILSGTISEYYNMTEMTNPVLMAPVVRSGVNLDAELAPFVANPPANLADANRYWERRQAMRGQVPANSIVLNGRNVFSPADSEIWVARSDSTIALRSDPYERRAFRDAHILDDNYNATTWDGNGYRILMGSLGIKGMASDAQALLVPARTFDTVTNAPVGGVNYSFSKYRIEVTTQPVLSDGVDPAANNPPQAFDRNIAYSIVDYNLENLYDYRNNPFSGCDFTSDTGCPLVAPFLAAVTPPYDYVPASDAAYQARLNDIALQIINDLHNPDILMVQEVENQDICTVTAGALTCGLLDNADGKPDVLQELALKIASLGGPAYDAAFDRDSSDLRGIAPAFLYRTDRVQLLSPVGDPILGTDPAIAYPGATVPHNSDVSNPKTFNAVLPSVPSGGKCETNWVFPRAPDVALFRIFNITFGGSYRDVYVINNHFKSGPDTCVGHRTEQAKYNAALVQFIQAANPNARIVVGGDLNVYPRPDDPFAPIGQPTSSDQLGSLYDPSLGLTNLWDVLLGQAPESAYSYDYVGMAQTLDQMFINGPMLADLKQFRIAHINSDFAADYPDDVARGTSDHDPQVATFFAPPFATETTIITDTPDPSAVGQTVSVTATVADVLAGAPTPTGTVDVSGGEASCTITLAVGTGSCNLTFITTGSKVITATYLPTTDFLGSSDTEDHMVEGIVPFVVSSMRTNANPTNAFNVDFTVTFSESVTGVDASDFTLTTTGVTGAYIYNVSGSGTTYTITVYTGNGNGTIRLDVVDDDSITDGLGNPLGGIGLGNGNYFSGETYTIIKTQTFADVPLTNWASSWIERLYNAGITNGCSASPMMYCPDDPTTRAQMAKFLELGVHGAAYVPPIGTGHVFADVQFSYWAVNWIEKLYVDGITNGCGTSPLVYCPEGSVTRAQMAVFLLRAEHGVAYIPPAATGTVFSDVPAVHWAAAWIEQLYAEGITNGCGGGLYCPDQPVTRAEMAKFLVITFNLP